MKRKLKWFGGAVLALTCLAATARATNILVNPGFETDAVLNAAPVAGATGWMTFGNAATASAPNDPVLGGIGSLKLAGGGNFSVPGADQSFPASPGQTWDLQGFMLTPATLASNATFGLLKIVFNNGTNDLPPGAINFGQAGPVANPGIESLPQLNSVVAPNTWVFTHAQGVAPAGTTKVTLFALMVDQSAGTGYFDNLSGGTVPEPSTLMLTGIASIAGLIGFRRRSS
jgi:hypothetical protein